VSVKAVVDGLEERLCARLDATLLSINSNFRSGALFSGATFARLYVFGGEVKLSSSPLLGGLGQINAMMVMQVKL
jgi:hypothetical protein